MRRQEQGGFQQRGTEEVLVDVLAVHLSAIVVDAIRIGGMDPLGRFKGSEIGVVLKEQRGQVGMVAPGINL